MRGSVNFMMLMRSKAAVCCSINDVSWAIGSPKIKKREGEEEKKKRERRVGHKITNSFVG